VADRWDNQFDDLVSRRLRSYRKGQRRSADDGASEPLAYVLDLPARTESLSPLTAFVTETARRGGLAPRDATFVEVAIYEACLNVIEHAYAFDASRRFRLDVFEEEDRLTFRIVDSGRPLAQEMLADPAADDGSVSREVRRAGRGLGLRIIRRAMDEVTYAIEEGENCMTLVKRLRETPARV